MAILRSRETAYHCVTVGKELMLTQTVMLCFLSTIQLWAHTYRQIFHADIDMNNITESINNSMRSRYLKIRPDATVFSLIEALVEVAFPAKEKRYIQATVKQMESYRKSRYPLSNYLLNWPQGIKGECLINEEKAKAIVDSMLQSTSQEGVFFVSRHPKSCPQSGYKVNVRQGHCSCAYFAIKKIPCKHMFAVFSHFPAWTWYHLPDSLTQAPHMILDESITQFAKGMERKTSVEISSEHKHLQMDFYSECDSNYPWQWRRQEFRYGGATGHIAPGKIFDQKPRPLIKIVRFGL